ncbi:hypothetical protein ACN47E_006327 [Coniothyrium glycines]
MATTEQNIILITGANGGIGFELVAQLLGDPSNYVLLGSRSIEKGQVAVNDLRSRNLPGKVELLQIDVASEKSIRAAAAQVEGKHGRIDALVNNAAINNLIPIGGSFAERLTASFLTNATGPAVVVAEFESLLSRSKKTPRIINQDMGIAPYRASKAALNMLTACQADYYGPKGWKVFAYCPGFTESGLSDMTTVAHGAKPTRDGARPIVGILKGDRDAEHAGFLAADAEGGGYKTKDGAWAW